MSWTSRRLIIKWTRPHGLTANMTYGVTITAWSFLRAAKTATENIRTERRRNLSLELVDVRFTGPLKLEIWLFPIWNHCGRPLTVIEPKYSSQWHDAYTKNSPYLSILRKHPERRQTPTVIISQEWIREIISFEKGKPCVQYSFYGGSCIQDLSSSNTQELGGYGWLLKLRDNGVRWTVILMSAFLGVKDLLKDPS
jgi:hypothetical protein